MTARGAVTTIVACTLLLAAIGLSDRRTARRLRSRVLPDGLGGLAEPGFDPVSVGVGLGLTQGAIGGRGRWSRPGWTALPAGRGARISAGTGDVPEGALLRRGMRTSRCDRDPRGLHRRRDPRRAPRQAALPGLSETLPEERQEIALLLTEDPALQTSGSRSTRAVVRTSPARCQRPPTWNVSGRRSRGPWGTRRSRRITAGVHAPAPRRSASRHVPGTGEVSISRPHPQIMPRPREAIDSPRGLEDTFGALDPFFREPRSHPLPAGPQP